MARLDTESVAALRRAQTQLSQQSDPYDPQFAQTIKDLVARLDGARADLKRRFHSPLSLKDVSVIKEYLESVVEFLSLKSVKRAFAEKPLTLPDLENHSYSLFRHSRRYELVAEHFFESGKQARNQRPTDDALKDIDATSAASEQFKVEVDKFLEEVRMEFSLLIG